MARIRGEEEATAPVDDRTPRASLEEASALDEIATSGGILAQVLARPGGDVLRVRDRSGRLVLDVSEDGAVVLHVADGDLELRAPRGRVRIEGADGVHIAGRQVAIETPHLRQVVGLLETHAKRIVEKAKDSYRDVEGISQLSASQVRISATKTFRAIAERLRMRAKKEAKIQGDKIYLG